jgi:hypothetical protein
MRAMFLLVGLGVAAAACAGEPAPGDQHIRLELRASPLAVKFVNASKETVRILKPLDGSEWCWVMPHYKLTVIDDRDREVGLAERCKLYGAPYFGTRWPDDYVVIIRPGDSYTHPLSLNHAIREAGNYRLRFEYRFTPTADGLPADPDAKYPAGLWRGSATSNTIETELKPKR